MITLVVIPCNHPKKKGVGETIWTTLRISLPCENRLLHILLTVPIQFLCCRKDDNDNNCVVLQFSRRHGPADHTFACAIKLAEYV